MKTKTGRKPKHYRAADGRIINGLGKDAQSNRWRVIASGFQFRENDEEKAIAKFLALTAPIDDPPGLGNTALEAIIRGFDFVGGDLGGLAPEERLWKWVADQIRLQPQRIARLTGIEEIGYLTNLQRPEQLPTFKEIETAWQTYANVSGQEKRKAIADWKDFVATASIGSITDITPETTVAYRDDVHRRGIGGKRQQHIFSHIRRLLRFAGYERALAPQAIGRALEALKMLKPNDTTVSLDPMPIEPSDFAKLLSKANAEDKAMILLMLNAGLYLQEVVRIESNDIADGCLITHRAKTGKCVRIAVLWDETLAAINALPRKGSHLFVSYQGNPLTVSGAGKRFRKLRKAAEVTALPNQLRDGAATAAVESNINQQLVSLLLGHRCGISDHYVKRNPKMVKPATDAIHQKYLGKP